MTSSSVIERGRRWGLDVAVPSILIVVIVVGVWWWLVDTGRVPTIVVPTPAAVWSALTDLVTSEAFRPHLVTTLTETLVAFLLAAAAGLAIAFLMTRSRVLARVVYPYVVGLQAVPKVILAPIFVIVFGFGIESKVALGLALAFFPILIGTIAGIDSVRPQSMALMRSMRSTPWQTFRHLTLPAALPLVFAGLKTGATLALIGAIVAEYVTARSGVGRLLITYSLNLEPAYVWALVIIIGALGIAVYGVMALVQRRVVWWPS